MADGAAAAAHRARCCSASDPATRTLTVTRLKRRRAAPAAAPSTNIGREGCGWRSKGSVAIARSCRSSRLDRGACATPPARRRRRSTSMCWAMARWRKPNGQRQASPLPTCRHAPIPARAHPRRAEAPRLCRRPALRPRQHPLRHRFHQHAAVGRAQPDAALFRRHRRAGGAVRLFLLRAPVRPFRRRRRGAAGGVVDVSLWRRTDRTESPPLGGRHRRSGAESMAAATAASPSTTSTRKASRNSPASVSPSAMAKR